MWDFLDSIICAFWPATRCWWDLTGAGVALAVHVLAFLGFAAFDGGAAVSRSAATDAAESMGSGQCQTEFGDIGHGYDRAHSLREADGRTEELQPEEQGQEKFSTPADVYCGDQRVRRRRTAQRRSSHGEADRQAFGISDDHGAQRREGDLRTSRLWFLLLGSGTGL